MSGGEEDSLLRARESDGERESRATHEPGDEALGAITRSSFIGVVWAREGKGREEEGRREAVDVLYRDASGRRAKARVRVGDAHDGFVGRALEGFLRTVEGEDGGERVQREVSKREARKGASALATTSEGIKMSLVDGGERGLGDIMTVEHMEALRRALPAMFRMRRWVLAYGTKRDGISLKSLYRHASAKEFTILVVSDSTGAIFGAFCTEAWKMHTRYCGTGESFVFTLAPNGMKYAWSGENDYYMLGASDSLSVGGGSAHAIRLEEDLLQGSSGECETYDSPRLSSKDMFETHRIELWSLE